MSLTSGRARGLIKGVRVVLLAAIVVGCGKTSSTSGQIQDGGNVADQNGNQAVRERTIVGRAKVTLTLTTCGRSVRGTADYSGELVVGTPREVGGQVEPNPFSLSLRLGSVNAAGALSLTSSGRGQSTAQDLNGNARDPSVLLTFWRIRETGGMIQAQLIGDPLDQQNVLAAPAQDVPCAPQLGSNMFTYKLQEGTIQGHLGDSAADLTITVTGGNGSTQATEVAHFVS